MTNKKLNLTKKQKEIIKAMREAEGVFRWSRSMTKFTFKGQTFRYDSGCLLAYYSKLMTVKTKNIRESVYTLTELGKTIDLT